MILKQRRLGHMGERSNTIRVFGTNEQLYIFELDGCQSDFYFQLDDITDYLQPLQPRHRWQMTTTTHYA